MAETVLIVDPDLAFRAAMVGPLKTAGYETIAADGFVPAAQLLESAQPDLVITVVRLGLFSGLHLVIRGRTGNPRMAALVVGDSRDPFLEQESKQAGATAYLVKPVDSGELLKRAAEALAGRDRRRSSRMRLAADVFVQIAAGGARLVDVSYGGFRLEFGSGSVALPTVFDVELPNFGLLVKAKRVWTRRADPADVFWCGAALASIDPETTQGWRRVVEVLRGGSASVL